MKDDLLQPTHRPPRSLVVLAFAAVYLIWGSTHLAIRIGVETLPPFLLGGVRFAVAGVLRVALLKFRGIEWPTVRQARNSLGAGAVMLLGGNGLVVWAEQHVSSSFAALFIASVPVWFAVFDGSVRAACGPRGMCGVGSDWGSPAWVCWWCARKRVPAASTGAEPWRSCWRR